MDYTSGPYNVMFPANQSYVSFDIMINNDMMFEGDEDFMIAINSSSLLSSNVNVGNPGQATVTIVDDDGKL